MNSSNVQRYVTMNKLFKSKSNLLLVSNLILSVFQILQVKMKKNFQNNIKKFYITLMLVGKRKIKRKFKNLKTKFQILMIKQMTYTINFLLFIVINIREKYQLIDQSKLLLNLIYLISIIYQFINNLAHPNRHQCVTKL